MFPDGEYDQAVANKCYRRMLGISYTEHKTNEYVWQQVNILGRWMSGTDIVNRQASQVIMFRPWMPSRYVAKSHITDDSRRDGMDRPVIVVVAVHRK